MGTIYNLSHKEFYCAPQLTEAARPEIYNKTPFQLMLAPSKFVSNYRYLRGSTEQALGMRLDGRAASEPEQHRAASEPGSAGPRWDPAVPNHSGQERPRLALWTPDAALPTPGLRDRSMGSCWHDMGGAVAYYCRAGGEIWVGAAAGRWAGLSQERRKTACESERNERSGLGLFRAEWFKILYSVFWNRSARTFLNQTPT
jgi:hypothetical protein